MRALRRDRAPGVPRRRHPRRAPPDGRRRDRAALGADRRHVRRGLRAGRPPDRRVHPRLPGRRARPGQRRLHDEALPRRRPAGRRRGSALPVRQGSGLPGRPLRGPPAAVRGGLRGRDGADHAVLRPSRSAPTLEPVGFGFNRERRSPACCAAATASTASSAPTGGSSPTCRCPTARSGRRRRGASRSSTPPSGWRRSSRRAATSSAARRCPSCSSSSSEAGRISESRIDESARRLLRDKFRLGLFDDPYVDPEARRATLRPRRLPGGRRRGAAPGDGAARERRRPAARRPARGSTSTASPRRRPPPTARSSSSRPTPTRRSCSATRRTSRATATFIESRLPRREPRVPGRRARPRCSSSPRAVPTILVVHLDRPAILTELAEACGAVVGTFGASPEAILDVVFGRVLARAASCRSSCRRRWTRSERQLPDVPCDSERPLFPLGHGLTYPAVT